MNVDGVLVKLQVGVGYLIGSFGTSGISNFDIAYRTRCALHPVWVEFVTKRVTADGMPVKLHVIVGYRSDFFYISIYRIERVLPSMPWRLRIGLC